MVCPYVISWLNTNKAYQLAKAGKISGSFCVSLRGGSKNAYSLPSVAKMSKRSQPLRDLSALRG
jgi:hypothetical protein